MKWGAEQDRALKSVADWMQSDEQLFRLFGYAGTGKTTLARHFAEGIEGTVLFGAYTGKAAHVLRTKGCVGASTIHSMIYHTKDKGRQALRDMELQLAELMMELGAEGAEAEEIAAHPRVKELRRDLETERNQLARPIFTRNPDSIVKQASLVVIDECSMVDGQMGQDLLSFGCKVLVLGDPAQLPPVGGAGFFTENVTPDVMLQDIHRQAADNPIIAMATRVRNKQALDVGQYGSSSVINKRDIRQDDVIMADQVLVGRNATRRGSNLRLRHLLGIDQPSPVVDDKLVCLRNDNEVGLLNGAIWKIDDIGHMDDHRINMTIVPELGGDPLECEAHMHYFKGGDEKLAWYEKKDAQEFDYGYALTVHKSQGSQWNEVMLFDESYCFRADRWRWLYTGITRAAEKLTVVNM